MSKVSVLVMTFNQENCIQDCINSILNQTFQDFEIIINDDCSTDRTLDKIQEIKDDRIKIIKPGYNQGINAALTNLIQNSDGEYVVIIAGDDMLKKNHLETMVNYLDTHSNIDTVYCNVTPIDEKGNVRKDLGKDFIKTTDAPSADQLHQAFMYGNFAISPGMTVRREAISKILPLPYGIINNQDFKIHIDLLINKSENCILPEKLVLYRQPYDNNNVSAKGLPTELRESLEFEYVMESFLKITDIKFLEEIFREEIKETGIYPYSDTVPFFLGRMAILAKKDAKKSWGYHKILNFLSKKENFDIVNQKYGFTYKDLLGLTKTIKNTTFHKCFKYKKLFNTFLIGFIISTVLALCLLICLFLF